MKPDLLEMRKNGISFEVMRINPVVGRENAGQGARKWSQI
jgi:hypothetical protein